MPWYLIEASHGPGHQSRSTEIRWARKKLNVKGKKELWDGIFGDGYDYPIGTVLELDGLTFISKSDEISGYKNQIASAEKMLKILAKTPVIPHSQIHKNICTCGESRWKCDKCGKEGCNTFPRDYGWCADCRKCGKGEHEWSKVAPIVCIKCGIEHPMEKYWAKQREQYGKKK